MPGDNLQAPHFRAGHEVILDSAEAAASEAFHHLCHLIVYESLLAVILFVVS